MTFHIRFWGVRGSLATPGSETLKYGGNTSCMEVRAGEKLMIVDAGTGIRGLGVELEKNGEGNAEIFLTHTHYDHICGLPFFRPAFSPKADFRCWSGHLKNEKELLDAIRMSMTPPIFPIGVEYLKACAFKAYEPGDTLKPAEGIELRTALLNHPDRACGYRFEYQGKAICVITDHEHGDPEADQRVKDLVRDADIMVYDAMYEDANYERHRGWGHSTWQACIDLALEVGVKTPVIFHHDPSRTDDELDKIAAEAKKRHPGAMIAREGETLTP